MSTSLPEAVESPRNTTVAPGGPHSGNPDAGLSHPVLVRLIIVSLGVAAIYLVLLLGHRQSTYTVSALTETVSLTVRDVHGIAARLPSVEVWSQGVERREFCCSLTLEVPDSAFVELARKRTGDLLIGLHWVSGPGARLIKSDGTSEPLYSGDSLRVRLERAVAGSATPRPETVLLAFRGEVRIGEDVARFADRALLSGSVRIVERALWSGGRYVAGEATLDPGDELVWHDSSDDGHAIVWGFVHVGGEDALRVVGHAAARYVSVERFGAVPYEIRPSPFERVGHDPALNIASIIVAGFVTVGALHDLIEKWLEHWRKGFEALFRRRRR